MEDSLGRHEEMVVGGERGAGRALECRECQVICERVVSPWRCLKAHSSCVYAFTDGESTYFGCLHKVFSPELDLAAFEPEGHGGGRRRDPYGALRVVRAPRPQCPVGVEQAYSIESADGDCVNPDFLQEVFRVHIGGEVSRQNRDMPADEQSTS